MTPPRIQENNKKGKKDKPLKIPRKLCKIVNLHIVLYVSNLVLSTRPIPIIPSIGKVALIPHLLLEWQLEEVLGERELLLDLRVVQTEVFDVEEADVVNGVLELGGEAFLAAGTGVVLEVEGHEFGPGKGFRGLGGMGILVELGVGVLLLVLGCEGELVWPGRGGLGDGGRHDERSDTLYKGKMVLTPSIAVFCLSYSY